MVSETHFTKISSIKIQNYNLYATYHPDGIAHAGAAIIIRSSIKHDELPQFKRDYIQSATIGISDRNETFNIYAIYRPPKHKIKEEQYN